MDEESLIPVISKISREVNSKETLDKIIRDLENRAIFNYYFLFTELNKNPNIDVVLKSLANLDKLASKMCDAYLIKIAYLYYDLLNTSSNEKTRERCVEDGNYAVSLTDFVVTLAPNKRLSKENKLSYFTGYFPDAFVLKGIFVSFPSNTVKFVNDSLEGLLSFKSIGEK